MKAITQMMRRELGAPILAAVALVAGALGLEIVPDLVALPASSGALAFAIPAAPVPLRSVPILVSRPVARTNAPLTLNEFINLAKRAAPSPVAKRFAKEFAAEPALTEALAVFRKERGDEAPAQEFFRGMARLPQFASLLGKFQSDPGFRQAFASVARDPRAEAALRGGVTAELASSSAGARSRSSLAQGKRGVVARSAGADSQGGSSAQRVGGAGAPGGTGGAAIIPIAPTGFGSSSADRSETRTAASGDGRDPGAAEGVTKAVPPLIGNTRDASCRAESLFSAAPKSLRDTLEKTCEAQGICNPVAACQSAGVLDQCLAVARSNPGCSALMTASLAGPASSASTPDAGDTKVVVPATGNDDGSLHTGGTPPPGTGTKAGEPTFLQKLAEGTGRVLGAVAGFIWGGIWDGGLKGALDGAAGGSDKGGALLRSAMDAVTGFFGSLF